MRSLRRERRRVPTRDLLPLGCADHHRFDETPSSNELDRLVSDKSIDQLLTANKCDLLDYGISWLQKSNLQLKMTGALIITNLTRNDQSAISILADKRQPDVKLVEQLKFFSAQLEGRLETMTDEQAKAAHGILGALRNLAVPSRVPHRVERRSACECRLATNRLLLVTSDTFDHVLPFLFTKNFEGEIAYKGKTREGNDTSFTTPLATGVIRFLLRDARETSKLAIIEDRIVQQIVRNSEATHPGLQCKCHACITAMVGIRRASSSRISPCSLRHTDRLENSSSDRVTGS